MPTHVTRAHRCCPSCGGSLRLVHRGAADRDPAPTRHYRCRDPRCGWEGLRSRERRARAGSRRAHAAARARARVLRVERWSTAFLIALTLAVGVAIAWVRQLPAPFVVGEQPVPRQGGGTAPAATRPV